MERAPSHAIRVKERSEKHEKYKELEKSQDPYHGTKAKAWQPPRAVLLDSRMIGNEHKNFELLTAPTKQEGAS
jgi:uncharacterized protein with ATP-grasp and redox domains